MKTKTLLAAILSIVTVTHGQVIISDTYDGSGTGFTLGSGINSGINPPTTRLTGTAAANLRYLNIGNRSGGLYSITGNRFQINGGNATGAATFSADGTAAFDFASSLGSLTATALNPITYDIAITMANNYNGTTPRFSLGIGTIQPLDGIGQAGNWDFGIQLHRDTSGGTAYGISHRIDTGSSGLAGDINNVLATTANGTYGSEINFVLRITDAGTESAAFNSRVQLSMDGGSTFFYDTLDDANLTSGFRFDGTNRYVTFDMAGNGTNGGFVAYDNFSITVVPEPGTLTLAGLGGAALLLFARRFRKSRD